MSYSQYFAGLFSQKVPNASVTDTTAPTFAGITSATPNTDGSITAAWLAATDATPPISYNIYIALGSVSAAALFVTSNLVKISPAGTLSTKVITLSDQTTYIVNGSTYTLGVRAVDAVGNINTNLVIQTAVAIASGNLPTVLQNTSTQMAATEVLLSADHVNFQGDHTNFQSDHTNFQTDHSNFVADDAAFDADHANFQTDHTNFQTDHSNFVADLATLSGYLSTFNGYLATFNSYNSTYNSNNSTFSASLVTLAADLVTLASDLSDFANQNSDLTAQVVLLTGLVSALQAAVAGVTSAGGLNMEIIDQPIITFEIVDDDGVLI